MAGRGFGKTRLGAEATSEFARTHPGARIALVGPTWRDVRDTMITGESGLLSVLPRFSHPQVELDARRTHPDQRGQVLELRRNPVRTPPRPAASLRMG